MNITPRSIIKGTNSDGTSYTMEDWDYSTLANLQSVGLFFMLIGAAIFSSIAGPITLVVCILTMNGRVKLANIFGILATAYFLIDASNCWIMSQLIHFFCDNTQFKILIGINLACLI